MHREIKPAETCVQAIPIKGIPLSVGPPPMMAGGFGWVGRFLLEAHFDVIVCKLGFRSARSTAHPELLEHNFTLPFPGGVSVGQQQFHIEHETACFRGAKCLAAAAAPC